MTKLEFIARQFGKAETKRFEHYVVTRIWHLLHNADVKIVTQQYVTRPNGRAMTDLYFPQLGVHVEVDEAHHKKQIDFDLIRDADIVDATAHKIHRIDVSRDIGHVNDAIDSVVGDLRSRIASPGFKRWNLEAEMNPQTYIDLGYLDVDDDVAFRRQVDAANCFGCGYQGLQRAFIWHPMEPKKRIWFPKLYENAGWINKISNDETTIVTMSAIPENVRANIDDLRSQGIKSVIVFAKVRGPMGDIMFRFKGEYAYDLESSTYESGMILRRIATRVKTYPCN